MLVTFQVLGSPMWLVATVLASTDIKHYSHHRNLYRTDLSQIMSDFFPA